MPFQEIDFRASGLDTDSDIRVMRSGDSDYRLNALIDTTIDNELGNVINNWGNIQALYTQPAGVNEVIGACKDPNNQAIIFFVWNSNNFHQIRRWFRTTNTVQLISGYSPLNPLALFDGAVLNFQRDWKIFHANVVQDKLLWTDGYYKNEIDYNEARKINIKRAIGRTLGLAWPLGYTTYDQQTITAIKYPPLYVPGQLLVNVPLVQSLLVGKYHQFFYRWVYDDFEKSVFSPIAPLLISQDEDGDGNFTFANNNAIDVTVDTGHDTVIKIEIATRINSDIENNQAFYVVEVVEKYPVGGVPIASNIPYTYRYFGDKIIEALDPQQVFKTNDWIPIAPKTQEVLEDNVLVYANYWEGNQTPTIDLQVEAKLKRATDTAPTFLTYPPDSFGKHIKYRQISFKMQGIYRVGIIHRDKQGRVINPASPNTAQVQIPWWKGLAAPADIADQWELSLNQKPYLEWDLTGTLSANIPIQAVSYEIVCTKDTRNLEKSLYFPQWGAALGDKDAIYQNEKTTLLIPSTVGYSFDNGDRIRLVAEYSIHTSASVVTLTVIATGSTLSSAAPGSLGLAPALPALSGFGTPFGGGGSYPQVVTDTYNIAGVVGANIYDFTIQKFDVGTGRITVSGEINGLEITSTYVWEIYNPTKKITEKEIFYGVGKTFNINNPGLSTRNYSQPTGTLVNGHHLEGIDIFHRWKKIVFRPQRVKFKADFVLNPATIVGPHNASVGIKVGNLNTPTVFKRSVHSIPSPVIDNINTSLTAAQVKGFDDEIYKTTLNGDWPTFNMFYVPSYNAMIINVLCGNIGAQNVGALVPFNSPWFIFPNGDEVRFIVSPNTTIEFDTWNNPAHPFLLSEEVEPLFNIYLLCESHAISDFYPSEFDSTGKGYVENDIETRQHFITDLRHGGRILEDSQVNNLLNFDSANVNKLLQDQYGEISRLRTTGYTLKIRQKVKNNSMYIGRKEIADSKGNIALATTEEVFGTINPSLEFYGSYHPGADVAGNNSTYFFDVTNGVVIRDAVNGMIPISGNKESANDPYKMSLFFRGLAQKVRNDEERYKVIGMWDEVIESYVLTVKDTIGEPIDPILGGKKYDHVTVVFHEPTNRWKTFMSYIPEFAENIGDSTVTFKDGTAWVHYKNPIRNNYYGVQYNEQIAVICNIGANTKKVFNNIDIDSNVAWDLDITLPPNSTYPLGMLSRLKKEKLVSREGKFSASFMKDMLTPGFTNQTLALVNGRELRGEAMRILMINNETKLVILRQVTVFVTGSDFTT